jgi:hypothetical protein
MSLGHPLANGIGAVSVLLLGFALTGCETPDATQAVLDNDYPAPAAGSAAQQTVVLEAWWQVALFAEPVAAGTESAPVRAIQGTDEAYAVLAPGWDPSSSTPPATRIPVRVRDALTAQRGSTLHIHVSPDAVVGDCSTGAPLAQDDADFITQRVFPGDFASVTYDAATCTAAPKSRDGGAGDAAADAVAGIEPALDAHHSGTSTSKSHSLRTNPSARSRPSASRMSASARLTVVPLKR